MRLPRTSSARNRIRERPWSGKLRSRGSRRQNKTKRKKLRPRLSKKTSQSLHRLPPNQTKIPRLKVGPIKQSLPKNDLFYSLAVTLLILNLLKILTLID